ncbi:MAG: flagellar FliJ family protein [Firmicutes bacterium]|nr:flagellar FliJ family protein [Bacillota bacterium]
MARFNFRLEPVLKCRIVKEEQKILALAQAQREEEEREEQLKVATAEYLESLQEGGRTLWELQQWAYYRDLLRQQVKDKASELNIAAARVADCRLELLDARQERLTVEKVKERRYAIFLEEEASRERRHYDEISQLVFQGRTLRLPVKGGE